MLFPPNQTGEIIVSKLQLLLLWMEKTLKSVYKFLIYTIYHTVFMFIYLLHACYMCTCVNMCVYAEAGVNVRYISLPLSIIWFWDRVFLWPWAHQLSRVANELQGSACLYLSSSPPVLAPARTLGWQMYTIVLTLCLGAGDLNVVGPYAYPANTLLWAYLFSLINFLSETSLKKSSEPEPGV